MPDIALNPSCGYPFFFSFQKDENDTVYKRKKGLKKNKVKINSLVYGMNIQAKYRMKNISHALSRENLPQRSHVRYRYDRRDPLG